MDILHRAKGSLLGLAVGDAVGTATEFKPKNSFTPITDMVGGGVFRLNKGEWTDDTSMALCLADSLIACQGFDASDQMQRYCRWYLQGENSVTGKCFDIGNATRKALEMFLKTKEPYSGATHAHSSGNGSLMRLVPVVLAYHSSIQDATHYAILSSKTTHASPDCLSSCAYYAQVLWQALHGEQDKDKLFNPIIDYTWSDAILPIINGEYKHKTREQIFGKGYVIASLETALWCFYHTDNFKDAILLATNLGDDADTTSAICGQLAGAYYGLAGIPQSWQHDVAWAEHILTLAQKLMAIKV